MFTPDHTDALCASHLLAFRMAESRHGMSQESLLSHIPTFDKMHSSLHYAVENLTHNRAAILRKPSFFRSDKVLKLALVAATIGGIAALIYLSWKDERAHQLKRAALVKQFDDALKHVSQPGFNVTREDGTATSFGKLYINGRPASEVRQELQKYVTSSKEMTPIEKAQCITVLEKSSNQILRELDSLKQQVTTLDKDRERELTERALQSQVTSLSIRQSAMSMQGLSAEALPNPAAVVTAAALVVPMVLLMWGSYRIIMWLLHQFS